MEWLKWTLQIIAGLGILNVWLLRRDKKTPYRGKGAENMIEEFKSYGMPVWSVPVIGGFKILAALGLLVGIFVSELVLPSAALLGLLMLGALSMHLKVKDPLHRSLPAIALLAMCATLVVLEM